jgi:hypothetical protein
MIQYDTDGVTLFYFDATGKKISQYFMSGAPYDDMLTIRSAQQQAIKDNAVAASHYTQTLANIQTNADTGRPHDAPPLKPQQQLVSDTGVVSFAPFDPPLADFVTPVVNAPNAGVIAQVVPDKQAIMYNMILAMFRKMFPDA